jgi:Hemerythrin HHE cation binding domain
MCHYCGCREMPLLRDYIAEHERATNFGGDAVRAIDRGDLRRACHLLGEMATELAAHWQGEETGLFRVLAREEMFAEHIAPLVREHRELANCSPRSTSSNPRASRPSAPRCPTCTSTSARKRTGSFPPVETCETIVQCFDGFRKRSHLRVGGRARRAKRAGDLNLGLGPPSDAATRPHAATEQTGRGTGLNAIAAAIAQAASRRRRSHMVFVVVSSWCC